MPNPDVRRLGNGRHDVKLRFLHTDGQCESQPLLNNLGSFQNALSGTCPDLVVTQNKPVQEPTLISRNPMAIAVYSIDRSSVFLGTNRPFRFLGTFMITA